MPYYKWKGYIPKEGELLLVVDGASFDVGFKILEVDRVYYKEQKTKTFMMRDRVCKHTHIIEHKEPKKGRKRIVVCNGTGYGDKAFKFCMPLSYETMAKFFGQDLINPLTLETIRHKN